ncbi:hypothetical protein C8T65DRAFT_656682 [Cerioporus squamosus]|nr:hypothetical protein C8T65DRAFT_656682 [Cerioporus squamosus]
MPGLPHVVLQCIRSTQFVPAHGAIDGGSCVYTCTSSVHDVEPAVLCKCAETAGLMSLASAYVSAGVPQRVGSVCVRTAVFPVESRCRPRRIGLSGRREPVSSMSCQVVESPPPSWRMPSLGEAPPCHCTPLRQSAVSASSQHVRATYMSTRGRLECPGT